MLLKKNVEEKEKAYVYSCSNIDANSEYTGTSNASCVNTGSKLKRKRIVCDSKNGLHEPGKQFTLAVVENDLYFLFFIY